MNDPAFEGPNAAQQAALLVASANVKAYYLAEVKKQDAASVNLPLGWALRLPICHRKISQPGAQLRKKRLTKSSSLMFQTGKHFWIWRWQSTKHWKNNTCQAAPLGAVCFYKYSVMKTACLAKVQWSQRGSETIGFCAQWRQFQHSRGGVRRR